MRGLARRENGIPWPWEALPGGRWLSRLALAAIAFAAAWAIARLPLTYAVALLLAVIVGVAILLRPALGLPLLAFTVPFGSLKTLPIGGGAFGASEMLLAAITAAWLLRGAARRSLRITWPAFAGAGLALLGVMLLSFLPATSLSLALKELVKWTELWLAAVLVVNLADELDAALLVAGLLAAGVAEGLHGLYQFLTMSGPPAFVISGRFMRAAGTFDQPNPYGGFMGLILPLAVGLVLCAWPGREARRQRWRWLLWAAVLGCAAVIAGGVVASWSRGAWLGVAAALAAVLVARGGRWLWGALGTAVLVTLLSLAVLGRWPIPGALQERFADYAADLTTFDVRNAVVTDANFAVVERVAHWQAAWGMFSAHPWTGVGLGNYAVVYDQYALPRWRDPLGHAHNYYLNIAAEAGLPGLAAYLLWVGAGLWVILRALRVSRGAWRGVALGALGMWVHLAVHNVFDNLYVHGMAIYVGLLLGLAAWLIAGSRGKQNGQTEPACDTKAEAGEQHGLGASFGDAK